MVYDGINMAWVSIAFGCWFSLFFFMSFEFDFFLFLFIMTF
jgi:hypothetical protein